jgi:succinoglycan biosynthesis transport protein ExoP
MTPKQIMATLTARWPWAMLMLAVVVGGVLALSLTTLKRYTATAEVMLDMRTPDQIAVGAPNVVIHAGFMGNQKHLVSSERVGRTVIKSLKLTEDPKLRDAWQRTGGGRGDYEAWLSELLLEDLVVGPTAPPGQGPVLNVLTIGYTAHDPEWAALIANAYVKAYVETSLEMRAERSGQYGGFFGDRARELRGELERAQAALSAYQQTSGLLLVSDDRMNVELLRLSELNSQLTAAQAASAEVGGRLRRAGRQTDQLQEVWRNPAVAALEAEVTRGEVKLGELTSRLGEQHPQLVEQQARLAELRVKLDAEKGRVVANVGFDNSAGEARVTQISVALEAQRARVLKMQAQREKSLSLQRDVQSAQQAYDTIQQRVSQASLESQNTFTNMTVLKYATAPLRPSSPKLLKILAASFVLGSALGLCLVFGWEHFDRRMRTVDDLSALRQPVLVMLPASAHARKAVAETSRTKLMKQRVLTGLPRPAQQPTT